jgi:hypothetical protein
MGLSISAVTLWAVNPAQLIETVLVTLIVVVPRHVWVLAGPHVVIWVATS